MTITILGTDFIGPGAGFAGSTASLNESVFLLEGVSYVSTGSFGIAINGSGGSLNIAGTVIAENPAVTIGAKASVVTITDTGWVQSVNRDATFGALRIVDDNVTVNNAGTIISTHYAAVEVTNIVIDSTTSATNNILNNIGKISGATGVLIGYNSLSAGILAGPFTLYNDGDILGTGTETTPDWAGNGAGVFINMGQVDIFNAKNGSIVSTADDGAAIEIGQYEIQTGDSADRTFLRITNYGEITSVRGVGIDFSTTAFPTASTSVVNFGTVSSGQTIAMLGGENTDTVVNGGIMTGDVFLEGGNDFYNAVGAGVVSQIVDGGSGDDVLRGGSLDDIISGGLDKDLLVGRGGDDTLLGGVGADTIFGGDGDDEIDGGTASDLLRGNDGDDFINGGGGNNTMFGGGGDDTLLGGIGNDAMRGNRDDDDLHGGGGNDTIRGDIGEDTITGGDGVDILTGGTDSDVFVWTDQSESGLGVNADIVTDFEIGVDRLNVSGLAATMTYVGGGSFTSAGVGEVRVVDLANGSTRLIIDADGDAVRDMHITIEDVQGLTGGDFIL